MKNRGSHKNLTNGTGREQSKESVLYHIRQNVIVIYAQSRIVTFIFSEIRRWR